MEKEEQDEIDKEVFGELRDDLIKIMKKRKARIIFGKLESSEYTKAWEQGKQDIKQEVEINRNRADRDGKIN